MSIHRNLQFTEYLNTPSIYQLTVVNSRSIQIDICHLHRITLCCRVNTTGQKHGAEWHITFRWGGGYENEKCFTILRNWRFSSIFFHK